MCVCVCVCVMRFVLRSLCRDGCVEVEVGVCFWGVGLCGCVSEFWTSGIVYMLIHHKHE